MNEHERMLCSQLAEERTERAYLLFRIRKLRAATVFLMFVAVASMFAATTLGVLLWWAL